MSYFILNDGNKVPVICFGPGIMMRGFKSATSFLGKITDRIHIYNEQKKYCAALDSAIENGARFFDYSASYGREDLLANAIRKSGVERKNFVLTTRVSNKSQYDGNVRECFLRSLERYREEYIDLLMFHWPVTEHFINTWEELIKIKEDGLCKSIGVANCHSHHIDTLIKETGVVPAINQVEIHPLFSQKPLLDYCKKKGIQMEAYTPLGRMDDRLLRLPRFQALCRKYNVSASQIILRWHIQNGVIPVFRSLNPKRQKENFNIFNIKISKEDMQLMDSFNINSRLRYNPDNCDFTVL